MQSRTKHTRTSQTLTLVLLVCYIFSPLCHHANDRPLELGKLILQLQESNRSLAQNSTNNRADSDSFRILKSIAGLNVMQIDTDNTDQSTIIVELKTSHLLTANSECTTSFVSIEIGFLDTFPNISNNFPPETPPPTIIFV